MLSLVIDISTILNKSQSKLILKPSLGGLGSIPYNSTIKGDKYTISQLMRFKKERKIIWEKSYEETVGLE